MGENYNFLFEKEGKERVSDLLRNPTRLSNNYTIRMLYFKHKLQFYK